MPHTLLLADDSLAIQRVVELTFAGEDIRVVAVGDGQQAIERLTADRPDIVLADIAMPLADGYAVAEFVRSTPAIADVPVLLLAGAFDIVEDARLGASGARGVLVKPFEPHVVISRVRELLGLGSPAEAPAPPESGRLLTPAVPPRPPRTLGADPPFWRDPVAGGGAPRAVATSPRDGAHATQTSAPAAVGAAAIASHETPPVAAPPVAPETSAVAASAASASSQTASAVPSSVPPAIDADVLSALVDRIAARVVEQLSERLRDEVIGVVLDVSERLVREEIARIRDAARANDAS